MVSRPMAHRNTITETCSLDLKLVCCILPPGNLVRTLALRPWIAALRLFLALAIIASAILRPPGAMAERVGDTLTYVICTDGATELITVSAADGREIPVDAKDPGCDFFAHQIAMTPAVAAIPLIVTNQRYERLVVVAKSIFIASVAPRSHAPRGPPALI